MAVDRAEFWTRLKERFEQFKANVSDVYPEDLEDMVLDALDEGKLKGQERISIHDAFLPKLQEYAQSHDKCKVMAGSSVKLFPTEKIELTETQCNRLPPGKPLGRGSYATAYLKADDPAKVVKFTGDPADAQTSLRLKGKKLKGAVNVYEVVKLKGPHGKTDLFNPRTQQFDHGQIVPIYGIVTEKITPLTTRDHYAEQRAVDAFYDVYRTERASFSRANANSMTRQKVLETLSRYDPDIVRRNMITVCESSNTPSDKPRCTPMIDQILDAVSEVSQASGIVPLDLHAGNWGVRNGDLVILDFGVSRDPQQDLPVDELAGIKRPGRGKKKNAANLVSSASKKSATTPAFAGKESSMRRRRSRSFGALDFKSPKLWAALAALGVGAWFLFRPKTAAASTPPMLPTGDAGVPAGAGTGADVTSAGSATVPTFTDPGSGVKVAGPAGTIGQDQKRTVSKGESWSNIASRAYGDYRWWPYLWDANRMGAKYQNPSLLRVGDEITVPRLPNDAAFKAAIFARAEADRKWEVGGKKGQRPASTFVTTATPAAMLPPGSPVSLPPAGGGVTPPTVAAKEPLVQASGSKMGPGNVPTTDVMISDMDQLESGMRAGLQSRK